MKLTVFFDCGDGPPMWIFTEGHDVYLDEFAYYAREELYESYFIDDIDLDHFEDYPIRRTWLALNADYLDEDGKDPYGKITEEGDVLYDEYSADFTHWTIYPVTLMDISI